MLSDEQKAAIFAAAKARSEMREEHPEEYRAALLLQSLLDGVWFTPRDIGGAQGMHDFDLKLNDGRTFAVEVTSDKSQTDTAFQSQVEQINPLPAPDLAHSWAEALHHVERFGLDGLEAVDLQRVDAVWVALDAGPGHAPDCRHLYPILRHDADGWHDWRMRRS